MFNIADNLKKKYDFLTNWFNFGVVDFVWRTQSLSLSYQRYITRHDWTVHVDVRLRLYAATHSTHYVLVAP